jgi:putative ABC transport system permease protein
MLTEVHPVTPGYFSTLGIRVVRGRSFTPLENGFGAPPVLVVSQALADQYFPGEDPIGKRLTLGIGHDTAQANTNVDIAGEIIGVVADVKQRDLASQPTPSTYVGYGTFPQNAESFLVRTQADPAAVTRAIRQNMRELDANVPVYDVQTMAQALSSSVAQPRFYMTLLASFAALALLLAALGIYGVISYSVSQRSRELGIRIALGATREGVVKLVLGQGMALTVGGAVAGLLGAYGLTRLIANLLFGVPPLDTLTFASVPLVLVIVAWFASYIPARRAAKVDPVIAMRAE